MCDTCVVDNLPEVDKDHSQLYEADSKQDVVICGGGGGGCFDAPPLVTGNRRRCRQILPGWSGDSLVRR